MLFILQDMGIYRIMYQVFLTNEFTFGGNFKTTLNLTYGHSPGEYIPNPLDIIGPLSLSASKQQSSFRIKRGRPDNENIYLV